MPDSSERARAIVYNHYVNKRLGIDHFIRITKYNEQAVKEIITERLARNTKPVLTGKKIACEVCPYSKVKPPSDSVRYDGDRYPSYGYDSGGISCGYESVQDYREKKINVDCDTHRRFQVIVKYQDLYAKYKNTSWSEFLKAVGITETEALRLFIVDSYMLNQNDLHEKFPHLVPENFY
ncbi:hypothetical protein [Cohnella soli]|uniref:Uncharacterized protein n=1 Tax=Cohnella soli TaxID=425005 RepID=A0ABW0HLV0_9BACL